MKTIGVALLSSVFTAFLVFFVLKDGLFVPPLAPTDVLNVRELRIVDDSGTVRMTLGTHGRGSNEGNPAIELLPRGLGREGAGLRLDDSGKGTLWFSSADTLGKMMVGHFITGDVMPPSQSDHSWGVRVINAHPVTGAPDSVYVGASEGGNVEVTGVTIKQGLPPDVHPVRIR